MSLAKSEHSNCIGIDAEHVRALAFTANGEYLVGGCRKDLQVWRIKDGERVATMKAGNVESVTVSNNGRLIAAGSFGKVSVWNATDFKQVFGREIDSRIASFVLDVDFSPDSTKLVSANGGMGTATVWGVTVHKQVQTLEHEGRVAVTAAKYSPRGDRIATATEQFIRIWGDDGHLLLKIRAGVELQRGLIWVSNHLFVKAEDSIKQIDACTGLTISEWSVPRENSSCIVLAQHADFVARVTRENITSWDNPTYAQVSLILQGSNGCHVAFSPDDRLFAVVTTEKIIIGGHFLIKELDIRIENTALIAWRHNELADAEALLTAAIPTSSDTAHHLLAGRALVRARLRLWDAALLDAEKSIKIQSSVVGYIAKCAVLVGKGEILKGCRVCDIAFQRHPSYVSLLLLIKAVVLFIAGEHEDAMSRIADLIGSVNSDPSLHMVQAYMFLFLGNSHMGSGDYKHAIQSFKDALAKLGNLTRLPPLIVSLISGWNFDGLTLMIQQQLCEALFSAGRINEAGESLLRMVDQDINTTELFKTWASEFAHRCLSTKSFITINHITNASHPMTQLFRGWARLRLTTLPWERALATTASFTLPRSTIYQVICECLEAIDQVAEAVACFHKMRSELEHKIGGELNWTRDFECRCCAKLEHIADIAVSAREYDQAISQYTTALSLNAITPQDLLVKRSKAFAGKAMWEDALGDAAKAIELDSSSPSGYERKYTALLGMGLHHDATQAFETMLSKMSESSDPEIRERFRCYVRPERARETIRVTIQDTTRDSPSVLIDTASGRLCNKSEQASAFEKTPAFAELVSSMTTHIDDARIKQQVGEYYRYATFSHKWEDNEPLFERVIRIVVYDLEASPTHEKLQMFCKIVRDAGFNWAWSDTCCINKGDHFVLQEALVSMFKWYERSSMTIIYLLGVDCRALRGALTRSIWNMRAWTLQEYHASKVVRIYTEDWTPYLGLTNNNHKDSPEIISEMEEATGISARALMALRPGLDDVREKLRLASTRQTTKVEDTAYSLLGIFSISLPITYGEGDGAFGRLLAQVLTSSGDTSILAWTGTSGSFNSCLPANIIVFSQLPTSHIPLAISDAEMERIIPRLRSLNLTLVARLYDRVNELLVPSFSGRRMRLPCLAFKLGPVLVSGNESDRVFRANTNALGVVEMKTQEDLSQLDSLTLVHPWIDFLLERQAVGNKTENITEENTDDRSSLQNKLLSLGPSNVTSTTLPTRTPWLIARLGQSFGGWPVTPVPSDTELPLPPASASPGARQTRALQFLARLRRPFGALLLTPTRRNVEEYRRVSAESMITVQVQKITPAILDMLTQDVRTLDVL